MNKDSEEVEEGLNKLRSMANTAVVVEGKRDKEALEKLGIKNIFTCIGTPEKIADVIKHGKLYKAVILTDFDDDGIRLEKSLREYFICVDIKTDAYMRTYFKRTFRVMHIEDMIYYARRGYGSV